MRFSIRSLGNKVREISRNAFLRIFDAAAEQLQAKTPARFNHKESKKIYDLACKDDFYEKDKLSVLLGDYLENKPLLEFGIDADIDQGNLHKYMHAEKKPLESTAIKLCLHLRLNEAQAREVLAAMHCNLDCTTSIPMCFYRSILIHQPDDPDYYNYEFFMDAVEKYAKDNDYKLIR